MGVCCCSMAGTNACDQCSNNSLKENTDIHVTTYPFIEEKLIYYHLASIAYDAVLETMREGEKTHPDNGWSKRPVNEHILHALDHLMKAGAEDKSEDQIAHAITRCAMIKYLEDRVNVDEEKK